MIGGAVRAGKAFVEIVLYDKQLKRGLAMVQVNMRRFGQQLSSIGRTAAAFSVPIVAGLATTVKAASDSEEYLNRFNAVFGDLSDSAGKFGDTLAKSVGRSSIEIKNALSGFQSFFVGLGAGNKNAAKLSQELTALAIDFASFNNLADDDAIVKFMAGISGEVEPLKRFGIVLTEARVNAKLLEQGFDGGSKKATEYQKALARFDILKDVLGQQGAIGDAQRTIGSFANQLKVLSAATYESRAKIGQILIPELVKLVGWVSNALEGVKKWADRNRELGKSISDIATKVALATSGLWLLGKALQLLPVVIAALSAGPVSAFGFAVAAVVGYMVDWTDVIEEVKGALSGLSTTIKSGDWEAVGKQLGKSFQVGVWSAIKDLADDMRNMPGILDMTGVFRLAADEWYGVALKKISLLKTEISGIRNEARLIAEGKDPIERAMGLTELRDRDTFGPFFDQWISNPLGNWRDQWQQWRQVQDAMNEEGVVEGRLDLVQWALDNATQAASRFSSAWSQAIRDVRMWWTDITIEAQNYLKEVAKGTDIWERTRTPVERAKAEIESINESFAKGFISQDTRDRAIDLVKEDLTARLELPQLGRFTRGALVGGFRAGQVFDKASTYERSMSALAKRQLEELVKLNRQASQQGLLFQ